MQEIRTVSRAARGWRLVAVLMGTMTIIAGHLAWDADRRNRSLQGEVRWLRARLGEKRDLIALHRQQMADVAIAVDRLGRSTMTLRERSVQARRLAQLEPSRERADLQLVAARADDFDAGRTVVSEDAAHALEELDWLNAQAADAADALRVLTILMKERANDASHGVPTLWPVRGLVTSPFGTRLSPWGEGPEMHAGLDISAGYGNPVAAAGPGEVVFAGRDGGYGGLVVVDHGGRVHTLYGHLSALYVREGQKIRGGQTIGAVGASGRATGAHLHYEVRVNGAPVDPRRYLAGSGTRVAKQTASRKATTRRRG
ncbi:MAG TPA: M23 family metallopeptidase [Candidatus Binatia bacterium]|nr:M23 family metallopeptidase [Candidatus Binatia bacterium]